MIYTARDGDVLDEVVYRHYQGREDALAHVLNANPGLARLGPYLPLGHQITLPELPTAEKKRITLWS
ncbi:MAG: tail protein X [Aeromonas veronii]|uniref:tail protein X n=1 Tax=Aeromonas veronii TaxID=654 RepID=UPI003D190CE2